MPRFLRLLFLIPLVTWLQGEPLSATERYEYTQSTGSTVAIITWEKDSADETVIRVRQGTNTFFNYCDPSGTTYRWRFQSPDTDIHVHRRANTLHITGTSKGKVVSRQIELDSSDWFQPLSYSLRQFLASDRSSVVFWTVRSDNLKAIKLKAVKECVEDIRIGDHLIETQRIKVFPVGLYYRFWTGTYWYRLSDRFFVKYKGNSGIPIPGARDTIVELRPAERSEN